MIPLMNFVSQTLILRYGEKVFAIKFTPKFDYAVFTQLQLPEIKFFKFVPTGSVEDGSLESKLSVFYVANVIMKIIPRK